MSRNYSWRIVGAMLAMLLAHGVRAAELEAIPLRYRSAEELIPLLQPLVQPDGVVTGSGDVLLVRASPANLAELRVALAAFDRAPRQLLITVGQATAATNSSAGAQGSVVISTGNTGEPPRNQPSVNGTVAVNGIATRDDIRDVMSLSVLEGNAAQLSLGQTRPFNSTSVTPGWHGHPSVTTTTEYRDVSSGFVVTPRVSGDRVTLEIAPQQQRVTTDRGNDIVHSQGAQTVVSGRLGEWIPIAGVRQATSGSDRGLATWGTRADGTQYDAWVKVELAP